MNNIGYLFAKIKYKLFRNNKELISNYFRKAGMHIGNGCNICCNIMTTEPFLVYIGNNVTISGDVIIITHDNSISKVDKKSPNIFGKVRIGDNCFIGQRSTIMYGVTLEKNVIVAAGSVVTKSFFQHDVIIGGNPARIISTWEDFYKKNGKYALSRNELLNLYENDSELIIEKR